MTRFVKSIILFCGIALAFAALPVDGQENADGITINKRPIRDLGDFVREKVSNKEVDLEKPFLVEIEGVLTKDGRLDGAKSKFIRTEGDRQMIEVAKRAIEAVNDGGWFVYLRNLGAGKIDFLISQDDKTVSSIIKGDAADENKAKTIASGLNAMFQIGKMKVKGEDEKLLLSSASVVSAGKQFIINFALPREAAQEMIRRKLKEGEKTETVTAGK
jgi:hypothetical protein